MIDVRFGSVADRTLFARDVVRYEGEIVAAVAAVTPEIAQRADNNHHTDKEQNHRQRGFLNEMRV